MCERLFGIPQGGASQWFPEDLDPRKVAGFSEAIEADLRPRPAVETTRVTLAWALLKTLGKWPHAGI